MARSSLRIFEIEIPDLNDTDWGIGSDADFLKLNAPQLV